MVINVTNDNVTTTPATDYSFSTFNISELTTELPETTTPMSEEELPIDQENEYK